MENQTAVPNASAEDTSIDVSQFKSVSEMKKATGLPYSKCYYLMKLKKSKKS